MAAVLVPVQQAPVLAQAVVAAAEQAQVQVPGQAQVPEQAQEQVPEQAPEQAPVQVQVHSRPWGPGGLSALGSPSARPRPPRGAASAGPGWTGSSSRVVRQCRSGDRQGQRDVGTGPRC